MKDIIMVFEKDLIPLVPAVRSHMSDTRYNEVIMAMVEKVISPRSRYSFGVEPDRVWTNDRKELSKYIEEYEVIKRFNKLNSEVKVKPAEIIRKMKI